MENQYRVLTGHQVNPANDTLKVSVVDAPSSGGANHAYLIDGVSMLANPGMNTLMDIVDRHPSPDTAWFVLFQNGPIAEAGVNGVTHEVLLEILIDRLTCFQAGPFANTYNATALTHLISAQAALQSRTKERMDRGVEGTHTI